MLFRTGTLLIVLANTGNINAFSICGSRSSLLSPSFLQTKTTTLHNYLDSLNNEYVHAAGNVVSATDDYLNGLTQMDAIAYSVNNAEDYIYNIADVFSSTSSFLADAVCDFSNVVSNVSPSTSINDPFSASTIESMNHIIAAADLAPTATAAAAAATATAAATVAASTPVTTTAAAAAAAPVATTAAAAPVTAAANVAGTSIPAAPAAVAAKATTVAATTTAAATAAPVVKATTVAGTSIPAAVAPVATKAAAVAPVATKAAAVAPVATKAAAVAPVATKAAAAAAAATSTSAGLSLPSLPDLNVPLPKVGFSDLSFRLKIPELEIPDYSNFNVRDLNWPDVPGTQDTTIGDVLLTVADGIQFVGKTALHILENVASDPTVSAILNSATKAVTGVVGSAIASVTSRATQVETEVSRMTVEQVLSIVVQILTVVAKILLSIVTATITVLSGRSPVEWTQLANQSIQYETNQLLAQASHTISDISHATIADLTASIGHFSHDVAAVLAASIDSSGSIIASGTPF